MGRYLLRFVRLLLLIPVLFFGVVLVTAAFFLLVSFLPMSYPGIQKTKDAQAKTAEAQMKYFQQAIQAYAADNGMPPTTKQGLDALVSEPTTPPRPRKWQKYLTDASSVPKDPWGNDYIYRSCAPNGNAFVIACYGADGRPGGKGYDADQVIRSNAPGKATTHGASGIHRSATLP